MVEKTRTDLLHDPLITIATPIRTIQRARGIHATTDGQAAVIQVRINKLDRIDIQKAADICDVTMSDFMRWCSIHAARNVIKRRKVKEEEARNAHDPVSRGRTGS